MIRHRCSVLVRLRLACFAGALLYGTACQTDPEGSDRFVAADPGFPNRGFWSGFGVYFPNRLIDIFDIVHVGAGFGPGIAFEIHPTRYLRIGAGAGIDSGVAWCGRMGSPFADGQYAKAAFLAWDAEEAVDKDLRWRIPKWDIGVFAQFYLWEAYLGVAPDEIVDFLCGLIAYDLKDDDYGRDSSRKTRLVSDGGVDEALPKRPGD